MTIISPREMSEWIIYRFFPASWERDLLNFLPKEDIARLFNHINSSTSRCPRSRRSPTRAFRTARVEQALAEDESDVLLNEIIVTKVIGNKPN